MSGTLTVDEMWRIVQNNRGFQSSPGGAVPDRARGTPATLPPGVQAGDKGHPVGKGYETFACLQVTDADGKSVVVGADFFDHGGLDNHAEARAIRGMEKQMPPSVAGGTLIVVVDQDVCPACEARLKAFAQKFQLRVIDVHVPERVNFNNPTRMASPKTTARTSLMNPNRPTDFRITKLRSINITQQSVAPAETAVSASMASLASGLKLGMAVTGAAATGLGVAATATGDYRYKEASDLLQPKMLIKWMMVESLKNLPKPKPDPRAANDFFTDPNAAPGLRTIDLLNKHLKPFGKELAAHQARVRAGVMLELVRAAMLAPGRSVELLGSLGDELNLYTMELSTVLDNLEAAQDLEPQVLEAAKSAAQLVKASERALVQDWLLRQGFDYQEMIAMIDNLKSFAAVVRQAFGDIDALHEQVQRMFGEITDDAFKVNRLYWSAILQPLVTASQPAAATPGIGVDAERVLRVLPAMGGAPKGRTGLSVDEIYQLVRKDGGGFIPGVQTIKTALTLLQGQGFASSVTGAMVKAGAEYWRESRGDDYLRTRPVR